MSGLALQANPRTGFTQVVGIGGIGTGTIFALQGNHTLGRNESRMGEVIDARDYCKLHIVEHYLAVLLRSNKDLNAFKVFAVGNVGDDIAGATLVREMKDAGIDTRYVRVEPEYCTMSSIVFLYPDRSGGNITASNSAASKLSSDQLADCRQQLAAAGPRGVALCLPEVPLDARDEFFRIATECRSYRVASFTSEEMEQARGLKLLAKVDLLALNREEAVMFAGSCVQEDREEHLLDTCSKMAHSLNPAMKILVSAGAAGAYVFEGGRWSKHNAVPTEAISTAGAGDALLAGTIAGLAAGLPLTHGKNVASNGKKTIDSAVDLGLALAAFSLLSPHTIHPGATLESVLAFAEMKGLGSTAK
ncbi:MAG: carbohydrate kinase family protein [Acidobacteriaceae bacterium]